MPAQPLPAGQSRPPSAGGARLRTRPSSSAADRPTADPVLAPEAVSVSVAGVGARRAPQPQSASLGELLLRTAAYNASPIRDPPNWPTTAAAAAGGAAAGGVGGGGGNRASDPNVLPLDAQQQLQRALVEMSFDDQREQERFDREMRRTEREEARKERSLLKSLLRKV